VEAARPWEAGPLARPADDDVAALRALVEGTARHTGQEFFQSLVRHLAQAVGTRYAFVAEFAGAGRARTLAFWLRDGIADNVEWDVAGTPCEDVVRGNLCHYPAGVKDRFPADRPLVEWGIESYLGVPLCDARGERLGHLAVFDDRPMPAEPHRLFTFHIFAARAAAELERLRLERSLVESRERYRDLYEEAPIAYVLEDLESRFISANRAALRILGLRPEEVPVTVGLALVPDTPEAQRRAREALASVGRGTDTSGVVLELRRKDDGRPVWVRWWSRPEPGGLYTRTMFVDVTAQVLAEQEQARLHQQNAYLQEEIKAAHNFEEIIGRAPALLAVLDSAQRVAPTTSTVLITGETGTGKELVARAIHSTSPRKDRPLIKVNCAALPAGLVESELFGHEKGAFTGALARRVGRFELAHGGTLFLDEVGELPPEAQAKLLRVLQEREVERVGGTAPIKVDVRVLAATNRDLMNAVREKSFREDLYYRLNVFPIHLPPLRERKDDVPLLVHFLLEKFAARIGRKVEGVSPETMRRLLGYPWPGNIRELENVLERAVILARGPVLEIGPDVLPARPEPETPEGRQPAPPGSLEEMERRHILGALGQAGWVIDGPRGAARALGLHPNTLRSRMKKLGISRAAHGSS
jgi:PAS domain S-box-containing protein